MHMKQLIIKYSISLSLVIFSACSTSSDISPSQSHALNKVSNSDANNNKGALQELLDNFLKNDWSPTVEKDATIQKKYMKRVVDTNNSTQSTNIKESYIENESRNFTLQEYADKVAVYIKANKSDHNRSHVHKVNTMPIIGKTKRR